MSLLLSILYLLLYCISKYIYLHIKILNDGNFAKRVKRVVLQ